MTKRLKITLLLSTFLVFHSGVYAIEREDMFHYQTTPGVIVRDLGNNTYMICDQNLPGNGVSFMKVTIGSSTEAYIIVDIDTVYDFEVFNGYIYFCGIKNYYGVLGYFPLAGFPTTTVQYLYVPTSQRLRKIEVGTMAGQTHMVAIGDGMKGNAEIVDAIDMGTFWGMHFFDANDSKVVLTDLAITDNYVVISFFTRVDPQLIFLPDAKVLYLNKPTTYGATFSPSSFTWKLAIKSIVPNILIEACEKDAFVVAAHAGAYLTGTYSVHVVAFVGLSYYSRVWINEPTDARVRVKDLKYDYHEKVTELLLHFDEEYSHRSIVFSLKPNMGTGTVLSFGHSFNNVYITSIYPNSFMPNHFFAAGTNNHNNIEMFLYHYDLWNHCTDFELCTTKEHEQCDDYFILDFSHVDIEQIPYERVAPNKQISIVNECISN